MENALAGHIDRPYKKMALVIEDDPDTLDLLAFHLKRVGYYPLVFTNAEDVLTILRSLMVEIIIIDLMLPGIDGVEFVREIERRKRRNAPILVISALDNGYQRAQQIHAEGYMQKPFSFTNLMHLVDLLVEERAAQRRYEAML
jgi:DNA-binding response OmpR family regulator